MACLQVVGSRKELMPWSFAAGCGSSFLMVDRKVVDGNFSSTAKVMGRPCLGTIDSVVEGLCPND